MNVLLALISFFDLISENLIFETSQNNYLLFFLHCALSVYSMEVEYYGGGVLIFPYLILIHRLDTLGGLRVAEAA